MNCQFIEVGISLYDKQMSEDLGIDTEEFPARLSIRISDIIGFHEAFDEENQLNKTTILLSNGMSYWVEQDYEVIKYAVCGK